MIILTAILILILNIPFGIWRKHEKRFSFKWFLAIHIPVAISILIRFILNIEFKWQFITFFVIMFFTGQYIGKIIYDYKFKKGIS